jgi:hypothetical protein
MGHSLATCACITIMCINVSQVFHGPQLSTVALAPIRPLEELSASLLPSSDWPSDHISLVAELVWSKVVDTRVQIHVYSWRV